MLFISLKGEFKPVSVKSIHFKRNLVDEIEAGNSCCFQIKSTDSKVPIKRENIRKGTTRRICRVPAISRQIY